MQHSRPRLILSQSGCRARGPEGTAGRAGSDILAPSLATTLQSIGKLTMELFAVAEAVRERTQAIGDEELAVRCSSTPLLIKASRIADVERTARRIHALGVRGTLPFVHLPTTGLPIELAMFRETCANLLETATGGTLLLSGVEEMPAILQDRLNETLDQLQSAPKPAAAVRLIAGTTACLYEYVAAGRFSARLFYRLNVIHVVVTDTAAGNDYEQERHAVCSDSIGREQPHQQDPHAQ